MGFLHCNLMGKSNKLEVKFDPDERKDFLKKFHKSKQDKKKIRKRKQQLEKVKNKREKRRNRAKKLSQVQEEASPVPHTYQEDNYEQEDQLNETVVEVFTKIPN